MATTPEGAVKGRIRAYLKDLPGCWFFMPVPYGYGVHGVPDFIVCYLGKFIALEVKAPGKEANTTPNQKRQITGINGAGGVAYVVSSVDAAMTVMEYARTSAL